MRNDSVQRRRSGRGASRHDSQKGNEHTAESLTTRVRVVLVLWPAPARKLRFMLSGPPRLTMFSVICGALPKESWGRAERKTGKLRTMAAAARLSSGGNKTEGIVNHDRKLQILRAAPSGQAPRCNDGGCAGRKTLPPPHFARSRRALPHIITHGFQVMASSSRSWSVKILQRCLEVFHYPREIFSLVELVSGAPQTWRARAITLSNAEPRWLRRLSLRTDGDRAALFACAWPA